MSRLLNFIDRQKQFQREVGYPIDSITESDRNEMSEKYVFKLIEEAVELRKEFPSVVNPWSKKQKPADLQRIKEEFSDVLLFLTNIAIVWKLSPEEIMKMVEEVQDNNFMKLKQKKMDLLNADILKIPGRTSGVGSGNLKPKYVFVGQNPGKDITQGYKFWSNPEDGSSKVLLPILKEFGIMEDCYFTNIVKCTTPDNEEPSEAMTEFYMDFLTQELDILRMNNPEMKVITMGNWASSKVAGSANIYHPAYHLRGGISLEDYKKQVHEALS